MTFHCMEQTHIELIIPVSDFESFCLGDASILLHTLQVGLADHLVVLASDVAGERSIVFQKEHHLLVLFLFAGFAVVKPTHSRDNFSRIVLASSEGSRGTALLLPVSFSSCFSPWFLRCFVTIPCFQELFER